MSADSEDILSVLHQLRIKCKDNDVDQSIIRDIIGMVGSLLNSNGIASEQLVENITKILFLSDNDDGIRIDLCLGLLENILEIIISIVDKMNEDSYTMLSLIKQCHKNAEYCYEQKYGFKDKEKIDKYVIYTVITGGYETLKTPTFVDEKADYICYTDDKNMKSDIWEIRYLENKENYDKVTLSRLPKILPHKFLEEYEYSVYVDGKMRCIGNFREYINIYEKENPMLCFPHFSRDCIYDEAETCIDFKYDDEVKIRKQMDTYRKEGMPAHFGLIDACCMVRRHNNKDVIKTMEIWWDEFRKWKSKRDQLCFNYACWKSGLDYDICDLYTYNNNYVNMER